MQIKITAISRFTTDKNNKPLLTRDGRPYERVKIQTETHGPEWLSGFGNEITNSWKEGDTVEAIVEKNGQYLNFSVPKKTDLLEERLTALEGRVDALEQIPNQIGK